MKTSWWWALRCSGHENSQELYTIYQNGKFPKCTALTTLPTARKPSGLMYLMAWTDKGKSHFRERTTLSQLPNQTAVKFRLSDLKSNWVLAKSCIKH